MKGKNFRNLLTILIFFSGFLVILGSVKADVVTNSKDWRDVYIGLEYSKLLGQRGLYITNLWDADVTSKILSKKARHLVLENEKKPVVNNFDNFLKLKGIPNVESMKFSMFTYLQFALYEKVKNKIRGFIVVPSDVGEYALMVAPFVPKGYWVLFYSDDNARALVSFLNDRCNDKKVIFVGDFYVTPWKDLKCKDVSTFVSLNDGELNLKIFEETLKWYEKNWVKILPPTYIEPGLMEGTPIIVASSIDVESLVDLLKKKGIKIVEVVGPENVWLGKSIRELSGRTIGVVMKVGRTFTGDKELKGKVYTLDIYPVEYPSPKLKITSVYYLPESNTLVLEIKNEGNSMSFLTISGLHVRNVSYELLDSDLSDIRFVPSKEAFFLPIRVEINGTPKKLELLGAYGRFFPMKENLKKEDGSFVFDVKVLSFSDDSKLEVVKQFYDPVTQKVGLVVKNVGNGTVYAMFQVSGMNLSSYNFTLGSGLVEILPGKQKAVYVTKRIGEDLVMDKKLKFTVYFGKKADLLSKKLIFYGKLEKGLGITGFFILIQDNAILISVIVLVFVALIVLVLKRRKDKGKK